MLHKFSSNLGYARNSTQLLFVHQCNPIKLNTTIPKLTQTQMVYFDIAFSFCVLIALIKMQGLRLSAF